MPLCTKMLSVRTLVYTLLTAFNAAFQGVINSNRESHLKLEIWGKAQRESARRSKSDWGKLRGGEFPRHQSHVARTQMHWYTPNALCRLRVGQH